MEKGLHYVVVLSLLNIQKFNLQDTLALRVVNKEFEHNIKYKIKHRYGVLPWENIKTFLRKKCKLQYNMGKVLTEIDLEDQTINDERILSLCKILKNHLPIDTLCLKNNQITNIDCLSQFVRLKTLNLYNNCIGDIESLKNLVWLKTLDLRNNENSIDLSIIKNLPCLTVLKFNNTRISDLGFLQKLNRLLELNISTSRNMDINCLKNLIRLKKT